MSKSDIVTNYSDINPTCTKIGEEGNGIQFGEPKLNQYGGRSIAMKYNNKKPLWKLPKMRAPFGIGQGVQGNGFNLQLSIDNDNDHAKQLETILQTVDKNFVDYSSEIAYELGITKKKTDAASARSVVEERYNPIVKFAKYSKNKAPSPDLIGEHNPNFPNYIQVNIQIQDSEVTTEFYDASGSRIHIRDVDELLTVIPRHSRCTVLATASCWSGTPGFGISLKAHQIRVYANNAIPKGVCLIDDPEDSPEEEDSSSEEEQENKVPVVEDDDDEEQEQEQELPIPVPVKPKRRITKKTAN